MALDNTAHDKESDPTEVELNLDLYEGLSDKVVNEVPIQLDSVPQQMSSTERWDVATLGLRKGKKRLPRSLDASFDLGTTLVPPSTRSKDKEGPSTARRGREGTKRKGKEKTTLVGRKQSCKVISRNR